MARARLKMTGKAHKRPQPKCNKCGETIEPGQQRWEWSFRYGGTHTRHQDCGMPRASELTQGRVGELYAAQEAIEDAVGGDRSDFDSWKSDVEQALESAAETARELGEEYREAAEPFGGAGENADRADECESWADALDTAASDVQSVEIADVENEHEDDAKESDARENAIGEVEQLAQDASGELGL